MKELEDLARRSDWLSRGDAWMFFEKFPDYVGRIQIVAWLANPFVG